MLDPKDRSLLTDLLQPPRGFELLQAVGTSFTLDLASALSVPLAFTASGLAADSELGIIAALTKFTDRITIFAQAGEMRAGTNSRLVGLLEDVLYALHHDRGIFHPKVWLLQYGLGNERKYRFLNLSRNLTDDKSWDLVVSLDGHEAVDDLDIVRDLNAPLVRFLERLPTLSIFPLPQERREQLDRLAMDIAGVRWEAPVGVSELRFHFLDGLSGSRRSPEVPDPVAAMLNYDAREALVLSPFLSGDGLDRITEKVRGETTVLSRVDSIDKLRELPSNVSTFLFDDSQLNDESDPSIPLTGLHAKGIFMRHRSRRSQSVAFIGSANATAGGLRDNIEFMVELQGRTEDFGPKAIKQSLRYFIEEYSPAPDYEPDPVEEKRFELEALLRNLASATFFVRVKDACPYSVHIWVDEKTAQQMRDLEERGIRVRWGLLTSRYQHQLPGVGEKGALVVENLRQAEITPFMKISLSQECAGETVRVESVLKAQLLDDIPNRIEAVVADHIGDGKTFLQFLGLLLEPRSGDHFFQKLHDLGQAGGWDSHEATAGLFEKLLKSLASGDDGLEIAHRIFTALENKENPLDLPDGFKELWQNLWSVREQELKVDKS